MDIEKKAEEPLLVAGIGDSLIRNDDEEKQFQDGNQLVGQQYMPES